MDGKRIGLYEYEHDEEPLEADIDSSELFALYSIFLTDDVIQLIVDETIYIRTKDEGTVGVIDPKNGYLENTQTVLIAKTVF